MEKKYIFIVLAVFLLSINLVSAINLDVSVTPVSNSFISDLGQPAIFDLTIKNLGKDNTFDLYSLAGLSINPKTPFTLASGQEKTIRIEIMPQDPLRYGEGYFTFEYKIKNLEDEILEKTITLAITDLENSFSLTTQNFDPAKESTTVTIKNKVTYSFDEVKVNLNSAFFNYETTFPLGSLESKEIQVPIDKEKIKTLTAGSYLLTAHITTKGKTVLKESDFRFLEQENIQTSDKKSGFIIFKREITKVNNGNVRKTIEITEEKDLFSHLFTTFNINPTETEVIGLKDKYTWQKELNPGQSYRILISTNWLYPIIIVLLIIGLYILTRRYIETDLILKKNVSFVRTKGGEFALKVTLRVRAKKFVERILLIDKLPYLVNLYEKYGAVAPDRVDLKNKRLEWDIAALNKGEERLFTYIIYSKIGVVGRFGLPPATATYEKQDAVKETISNRAFFVNKTRKRVEE